MRGRVVVVVLSFAVVILMVNFFYLWKFQSHVFQLQGELDRVRASEKHWRDAVEEAKNAAEAELERIRQARVGTGTPQPRLSNPMCPSQKPPSNLLRAIEANQNPAHCDPNEIYQCPLIPIGQPEIGFGYQMHALANCLLQGLYQKKVVIPQGNRLSGYADNVEFPRYFQALTNCTAAPLVFREIYHATPRGWRPDNLPIPDFWDYDAYLTGAALQYIFRPSAKLQQILDSKMVHADYGIHVRRTDKIVQGEAWTHELEQYMQALDRVTNPEWNFHSAYHRSFGRSVFIASDDPAVIQEAQMRYPQYQLLLPKYSGNLDQSRLTVANFEDLLVSLFSLLETKYFVGTFSSQISRMVYEVYHTRYMDAYYRAWSLDDPYYSNIRGTDWGEGALKFPSYNASARSQALPCL